MTDCPCGSQQKYSKCCEPYLCYTKLPENPEALMRSRYTAFTKADIEYIKKTMQGKALAGFQEAGVKLWAEKVTWLKLEVLNTSMENPNNGHVEFIAQFLHNGILNSMQERSEFIQEQGQWYYVDGIQTPSVKSGSKKPIPANSKCPCGSQKKFKNCHGR